MCKVQTCGYLQHKHVILCFVVLGVFFAKSDVGTGTIVGSAVFNILVIIGLSGLLTGSVIQFSMGLEERMHIKIKFNQINF